MIPKIFNPKLLLMLVFVVAAQGSFAQQKKAEEETDFNKQMQKLQTQMQDLQKQMQKLQTEKFKENSAELQRLSKELSGRALAHINEVNISGLSKGLGNMVSPNAYLSSPNFKGLENLNSTKSSNFSFNYSDDKNLQEKVKSGEVKEKTKAYSKSYSVSGNDKLQINNTYGKVTVNTWTKNEVKVDVQIKAYANEDDDAQKLLDNISITDSKDNSVVSFKTNYEVTDRSNNTFGTWLSSGKNHTRKIEVNYTVYMPAKSQLDITNRFGAVTLPDLSGKVTVNLSYGNLVGQQLTNTDNNIKVRFGEARIESFISGDINVSYGKLLLGTADKLNATVSFSSMNIDKLKSSGDINVRYGDGVRVGEFDKNFKTLSVDAKFTKIALNLKDNYDFDVTTHFGSFDYDNAAVKVISRTPTDNDRHYTSTRTFKGQVNKGNSDRVITIKSNYGSVKFD
ncbi:hypothetical protein ACFQ3S_14525 [Mucilaginibacter terrae]|uniref:hypothetical protein n=1 Tax=Mucilaginibacter terrae TaxID=1955052 RepID=UPI0036268DCE